MGQLIQELKRRNVFRMAVLYVVAAWLVMQVTEVVLTLATLPAWIGRAVLILLAVGFPIALIVSWFYEVTSEGISLEKDIDPLESITHVTGRRIDFVVISMLCAALLMFATDKWWPRGPIDQSILILPFVAMSSGEDDEMFADGLTAELSYSLGRIDKLKVAGSMSSFYYKGKEQDPRSIRAELGVGNVLVGSVRRAGNRLRISAQLVKADDGFQLWSDTYDRTDDDIFAIQEEIANEVAGALEVTLLAEEATALSQHGTTNTEAQSKYLIASGHIRRGATLWVDKTLDNEHLKAARRLLEEAVELDPNYAEAWARLSTAYYLVAGSGIPDGSGEMLTFGEARGLAGPAAERAIELAPDLPEAWTAFARHTASAPSPYETKAYLEKVEDAFQKALELDPDNLTALGTYANFLYLWGHYAAALEFYDRVVALDPLSTVRLRRAQSMYHAGHIDNARREYFEVARLYPDAPYEGGIAEIEFDRGHLHHGLAWLTDFDGSLQPPYAWRSLGDIDRALEVWSINSKTAGGVAEEFGRVGEYLLLRDYAGLENAAASSFYSNRVIQFRLPSLYYMRQWGEAISLLENWAENGSHWPTFLENITGAGGAPGRQYAPVWQRYAATAAAYYAHALSSMGRRDEAEPVWRWAITLVDLLPSETPRRIQEWHHLRLLVFASRGEKDAALTEFEAMVDAGWRWLMSAGTMDGSRVYSIDLGWFADSPLLDSIRDEPRFIAALDKVKADNAAMLAELNAGLTLEDIIDEDINF